MTSDLEEFERAAGSFLIADPVRNTVLLTVAATLRRRGAAAYGAETPQFGWYCSGEAVQGAFLRTPPRPTLVTGLPAQAVAQLVEVQRGAGAITAPADIAEAFARAWQATTGRGSKVSERHRLYRLVDLTPPRPAPPGTARPAGPADRDGLFDWFSAFAADTGQPAHDHDRVVDDRIANDGLMLWEVHGVPVSMAGATVPVGGTVRVAPVYTPPTLRGRGYAGAVTAAISRRAREAGHEVVLFTDLGNPTSNALYQRIGYRQVHDYWTLDLETATGPQR
ncbi:MAG: GNAT family N-acetyltransferase [Catenulisporales bacterium]|nr:GNAT family N-acetyltransferase [Catenulisporales bacterium]